MTGLIVTTGDREQAPGSISRDAAAFWLNLDPSHVFVDAVKGPQGERALQVELGGGRRFFTVFEHRFKTKLDLSRRPYLLVNFRGTGSGNTYNFLVDFDGGGSSVAAYQIHDRRPGWRQISFATAAPQGKKGKLAWGRVSAFRLATTNKERAEFAIGEIRAADRASFGD